MGIHLDKLTVKGFKSIKSLEDFELGNLNVFIGGNGSGKSNFIDIFRLLRAMLELSLPDLNNPNLQSYFLDGDGFDNFLFNGPRVTDKMEFEFFFGQNGYKFELVPSSGERVLIENEEKYYKPSGWNILNTSGLIPYLLNDRLEKGINQPVGVSHYIYGTIESWRIYHFHDTSKRASMRRLQKVEDNEYLRFDASNIAPFLLNLREKENRSYQNIVDTVRLIAPFFNDFLLKPNSNDMVSLSWIQKGSDYPMRSHQFSDGTIRFICLATALLQPYPPSTIIIDEPELGLHPYAIEILAELIKSTSNKTQLIVSTQSPSLLSNFNLSDIVVVNRKDGATEYERLNENDFSDWLEEYSLGDLWEKNVISGAPNYE